MPIRIADVPEDGEQVIASAMSPMMLDNAAMVRGVLKGDADEPAMETAAPHPVYAVGLQDLVQGWLLRAARLTGWRYLLLRDEAAVASATVSRRGERGKTRFSHVTRGPSEGSTLEAIRRAESLPDVADGDFELRLLDIRALHLRALWLHGDSDILLPLHPAPPPLEPFRAYSEAELVAALRGDALRRLTYPPDFGG